MSAWKWKLASASLITAATIIGCAAPPARTITWEPVVCYEARGAIERIRCGRPDRADPNLQAVSVDQAGDLALVHFTADGPRAEVLYRNGAELTGLVITDLDPTIEGQEIYAGGFAFTEKGEEKGGAVFQIAVTAGARRATVREIWSGSAYVHSIERADPARAGDPPALFVTTYAGEARLLTRTEGEAPWTDRLLYREPASADPEILKVKDAGFLAEPSGRRRHVALVALKMGRLLMLDLDRPEATKLVHEEPGGLSRVTPDATGGAYVTGYFGRLLHFVRDGDGERFEVLDQEGVDSGLRGAVVGDFPTEAGMSHLAVFGFHKRCRALVPRSGVLDPVTIHVDIDRGHAIEAAELVPDNDATELLIGGYSKRVTMLVKR